MIMRSVNSTTSSTRTTARRELPEALKIVDLQPTVLIGLGGAGGEAVRRVKHQLDRRGLESHVIMRVFDTDPSAIKGSGGLPCFNDQEFCHVSMDRIPTVLDDPARHAYLAKRLGLANPEHRSFLERVLNTGIDQAGQVRQLGLLSGLTNSSLIGDRLRGALAEVTHVFRSLIAMRERENPIRLRQRTKVVVISSVCGGSGGSLFLEQIALLRSLTHNLNVDICAYLLLPSVFENVACGSQEQHRRVYGNGSACLTEFDAFNSGFGLVNGIKLGPSESRSYSADAGMVNQTFLIGRRLADGSDLQSPDAVLDMLALHIVADCATELGDRLNVDDDNLATIRELSVDPKTGKPRSYSTIGASAVGIDFNRITKVCTALTLHGLYDQRILGVGSSANDEVDNWLNANQIGSDASELVSALKRGATANQSVYTNGLFQVATAQRTVYHKNSLFPAKFELVRKQFRDVHLRTVENRLEDMVTASADKLMKDAEHRVAGIIRDHGVKKAEKFVRGVLDRISPIVKGLESQSKARQTQAQSHDLVAVEALKPLGRFPRRWFGRTAKLQNRAIESLRSAFAAALDSLLCRSALTVLERMALQLEQLAAKLHRAVSGAEARLKTLKNDVDSHHRSGSVHTSSKVEVDVSSEELDRKLCDQFGPESSALLELMAKEPGCSIAEAIVALSKDESAYSTVESLVYNGFADAIGEVSVLDILGEQLQSSDASVQAKAFAMLQAGIQACSPAWQADSELLDVDFDGTLIIGVPALGTEANREVIVAAVTAIAKATETNSRYRNKLSVTTTADLHRIYVLRRVHGARPHYLPEIMDACVAYDEWIQDGGHPLFTFTSDIVTKMPSLRPKREAAEAELALALGLAMGFVAMRGSNFYENLRRESAESAAGYSVWLNSQWNGIAFSSGKLTVVAGPLKTSIDAGRISYQGRDDFDDKRRLGNGMDATVEALEKNEAFVRTILNAFETICEVAGNHNVANELEAYVAALANRYQAKDTYFGIAMRQVELLRAQIDTLRHS